MQTVRKSPESVPVIGQFPSEVRMKEYRERIMFVHRVIHAPHTRQSWDFTESLVRVTVATDIKARLSLTGQGIFFFKKECVSRTNTLFSVARKSIVSLILS